MKKFTEQINEQFGQVKPENLNENTNVWLNNWNGQLDSQNLPVNSIDRTKLVEPTSSKTTATSTFLDWKGQTQNYAQVRFYSGDEGGINDWLSSYQILLKTDDWTTGWNRLSETISDFYLITEAQEGMISGQFNINWWLGLNTFKDTGAASAAWGDDWWIRWGLFLNDNLIADTGNLYPREENTCVPFKVPVGTQKIRLDLRWKTITNNPDPTIMFDPTIDVSGYIQILGANIWANNTFK